MDQSQNLKAALLAIIASAILSFIDNFVFMVSQEAGLWQFQAFRALFALPVFFVLAIVLKQKIKPKNLKKTIQRSLLVSTGLLIYFAALGVLPVAQAAAGLFTSPLWVLVFSAVFFGVRVRFWQFILMGFGFVGALMLLDIDLHTLSLTTMTPIIAGAFYGLGMMVTGHWCRDESAITLAMGVFAALGLFSVAMLAGIAIWPDPTAPGNFLMQGWVTPTPLFFLLTLGQAFGAIIAVLMITQAYRIGDPAFIAVFEYSFLIFAAIWAFMLWSQVTSSVGLLGIAIILVSGGALSLLGRQKNNA